MSSSSTSASSWFRRITFWALLSGVCPLIPLPFLDDWAVTWVRKRMVKEQMRGHGFTPLPVHLEILAGAGENKLWQGCFSTLFLLPLLKISFYVVKKMFKKILIFLTLKDCVDRFSETFHEGYLLHQALEAGEPDLRDPETGGQAVLDLRRAVKATCEEVDPRPVNQLVKKTLRGSRRLLLSASRALGRMLRRERRRADDEEASEASEEVLEKEEKLLGGLLDRLTAALWGESGYLGELERVFGEKLAAPAAADPE